jgi:acetyl esterase/lipase
LADVCAPSKLPTYASKIPYVADLLKAGYVVAATDYEGLGTPGLHPYLVGESEGRGVLDAARAAQHLSGAGAGRDVVIAGHSQGGHAALFAGELAGSYAADLHLLGVIAAAPAADLEVILPTAGALKSVGGYLVMAAEGFHAAYPDADLAAVLTPEAIAKAGIVDRACGGAVIKEFSTTTILRANPAGVAPWNTLLHQNSAGNRDAGAPVLVVQGAADQLVVRPFTDQFVQKACARGDQIDERVYPGADHGGVIGAARVDVLEWIATVVKGDAVPSTCS